MHTVCGFGQVLRLTHQFGAEAHKLINIKLVVRENNEILEKFWITTGVMM
jgi:hypothetical protein